jgi:hypothetical protein
MVDCNINPVLKLDLMVIPEDLFTERFATSTHRTNISEFIENSNMFYLPILTLLTLSVASYIQFSTEPRGLFAQELSSINANPPDYVTHYSHIP